VQTEKSQPFWDKFNALPLIAIMRNISMADTEKILPIFSSSELTTVEVTMNSTGCEEIIKMVADNYSKSINVGAGTVLNEDDVHRALSCGAQFIVTPFTDEKIILLCKKKNIPVFPGAFTPTEIATAWNLGADAVKVFPVTTNGPEYIKAVLAPLNHIKLIPTGGVNLNNSVDFMKAGSFGLGMGSPLFVKEYIQNKDWQSLMDHFKELVRIMKPFSHHSA
jgi:2-dehydro-3-deoxyphosphogluconate aldolase / (4S)-4-hydroxy-2-oxoglutarate aldolase